VLILAAFVGYHVAAVPGAACRQPQGCALVRGVRTVCRCAAIGVTLLVLARALANVPRH
jgi:hypothetical protein